MLISRSFTLLPNSPAITEGEFWKWDSAPAASGRAEQLPFESDSFDLGYSFGVLHHSPETEKAIAELVRVVRPGGEIKIMLYNRHSVYVFNQWVKFALLRGKPWQSLRSVLWNHIESVGTKAYTRQELARIFAKLPLENISVHTEITSADYLSASAVPALNGLYRIALRFCRLFTALGSHLVRRTAKCDQRAYARQIDHKRIPSNCF